MDDRKTLTVEEAARALGLCRAAAYAAVARGELPVLRIGRRILVRRDALDEMLKSGRIERLQTERE